MTAMRSTSAVTMSRQNQLPSSETRSTVRTAPAEMSRREIQVTGVNAPANPRAFTSAMLIVKSEMIHATRPPTSRHAATTQSRFTTGDSLSCEVWSITVITSFLLMRGEPCSNGAPRQ